MSKRIKLAIATVVLVLVGVMTGRFFGPWGPEDPPVHVDPPVIEPVVTGDRVQRVVGDGEGLPVSSEGERRCVLERLDERSELVEALGDRPRESPRFGEVVQLAERCLATDADMAAIRSWMVDRHGLAPSEVQLRCVNAGIERYPEGDRDVIIRGSVVSWSMSLSDRLRELLYVCGLDGSVIRSS